MKSVRTLPPATTVALTVPAIPAGGPTTKPEYVPSLTAILRPACRTKWTLRGQPPVLHLNGYAGTAAVPARWLLKLPITTNGNLGCVVLTPTIAKSPAGLISNELGRMGSGYRVGGKYWALEK